MMAVQISNGVRDEQLKKKLWDQDLTLEQIIEKCQTHELRAESAGLYSKSKEINTVQRGRGRSSCSRGRFRNRIALLTPCNVCTGLIKTVKRDERHLVSNYLYFNCTLPHHRY